MCCIFTCCGWMIDLVQRLWTFTMSCCISSAVCCALVTASMSGIALGYNYSLAEYIDLKETNVSVYLKRGVFDDEIADDMDWRRSGHMPVQGHLRDSNLVTGAPENEEMPLRSGRRMDDSMVVSDDQHNFEGSLMRLTVRPPAYKTTREPVTSDLKIGEILEQYPKGSIEQMKAIHSLMNQRKANTQRNTKMTTTSESSLIDVNGRRVGGIAPGGVPMFHGPYDNDVPYHISEARLQVPDASIGNAENWMLAKGKIPESYRRTMGVEDYPNVPQTPYTYPTAIRFTANMKRPTRPTSGIRPTPTSKVFIQEALREGADISKIPSDEVQMLKAQILKDKENFEKLQNVRMNKYGDKTFKSEEDYAEQANKGVRKKRDLFTENKLVFRLKSNSKQINATMSQNNKTDSSNKLPSDDIKGKAVDSTSTGKGNDKSNVLLRISRVVEDRYKSNQYLDKEDKHIIPTIIVSNFSEINETVHDRNKISSENIIPTEVNSVQKLLLPKFVNDLNHLNFSNTIGFLRSLLH